MGRAPRCEAADGTRQPPREDARGPIGPCVGFLGKGAATGWDPCRRPVKREGVGTGLPSSSSSFSPI